MSINANSSNENPPAPGHRDAFGPGGVLAISMILAAIAGHYTDWQTAATVFNSVIALYSGRRSP